MGAQRSVVSSLEDTEQRSLHGLRTSKKCANVIFKFLFWSQGWNLEPQTSLGNALPRSLKTKSSYETRSPVAHAGLEITESPMIILTSSSSCFHPKRWNDRRELSQVDT